MIDRVGTELSGIEDVREEARRRALLLLSEGVRKGEDRRHWVMDVRDESGTVVLHFRLKEVVGRAWMS
jgi:hypothetical protein